MDSRILITGAGGQLGKALSEIYPNAVKTDHSKLDIANLDAVQAFDWTSVDILINAAGYTNVDGAETPEGKKQAWAINDRAVGNLADIASKHNLLLVHISTAYNLTNEGDPVSWADFTRTIFKEAGIDLPVTDTTYKEYSAGKPGVSPRPLNSVLDLTKIESIGFTPRDWRQDLSDYIKQETK
jgi:dTDP-4-dehydrorhamnose reductase